MSWYYTSADKFNFLMGGYEIVSRKDGVWDTAPWFMHQGLI